MTSAIPVQRSNQLSYQANWELVMGSIPPSPLLKKWMMNARYETDVKF